MQLCPSLEIFSQFFPNFLKSTSNFEHFGKKDEPNSWFISEVIGCEKRGYLIA